MTNYKHNVLLAYPIFFPNSSFCQLVHLLIEIPRKLFSEIAGKTLLSLAKLKLFLGEAGSLAGFAQLANNLLKLNVRPQFQTTLDPPLIFNTIHFL